MRWNETCVLVAKAYEPDDEGVLSATDTRTEVFCNQRSTGANTWSSMYEIGISPVADIEVRTVDYDGQRDVFYKGMWLSVEVVKEQGDMTILTLRHQQSDSDDDPDDGNPEEQEGGEGAGLDG